MSSRTRARAASALARIPRAPKCPCNKRPLSNPRNYVPGRERGLFALFARLRMQLTEPD
jgi:hypothetical protein